MEARRVHQAEAELDRGLLTGVAAFRWATWVWMALVAAIDASNDSLTHGWAAVVLIGLALAFTAWASVVVRSRPAVLLRPIVLAAELTLAGALVFGDQWVYGGSHAQSLGSAWPLASVLSLAIVGGAGAGAAAGFAVGTVHWLGDLAFVAGPVDGRPGPERVGLGGAVHPDRRHRRVRRHAVARGRAPGDHGPGPRGGRPHPARRRAADAGRRATPVGRPRPGGPRPRAGARAARVPVRARARAVRSWGRPCARRHRRPNAITTCGSR